MASLGLMLALLGELAGILLGRRIDDWRCAVIVSAKLWPIQVGRLRRWLEVECSAYMEVACVRVSRGLHGQC